jgi:membrane protein DedA with SNARE-associated domain
MFDVNMEQMLSGGGYLLLFLYSFGGGFLALIAAGFASSLGKMSIILVIIIAFISNMIGDIVLFYMARNNKSMLDGQIKKHKRKIAMAHLMVRKQGDKIVFIQKYIYGIKTIIPIIMGLTKYSFKKFIILNIFASLLWALVFGLGSFYAGDTINMLIDKVYNKTTFIIFALILLVVILIFYKKKNSKNKSN